MRIFYAGYWTFLLPRNAGTMTCTADEYIHVLLVELSRVSWVQEGVEQLGLLHHRQRQSCPRAPVDCQRGLGLLERRHH